ncbi:MAG: DUF1292 domain-containing protein [Clostridia bacterium]
MLNDDTRDFIEFEDEEGNTFELDILTYFNHEDEEYAVLCDVSNNDESEEEQEVYIMKVVADGDYEEFVPADEDKMDVLIKLAQEAMEECDCDDEDCDCDECSCEHDEDKCDCGGDCSCNEKHE